jgi:hypothetical protein
MRRLPALKTNGEILHSCSDDIARLSGEYLLFVRIWFDKKKGTPISFRESASPTLARGLNPRASVEARFALRPRHIHHQRLFKPEDYGFFVKISSEILSGLSFEAIRRGFGSSAGRQARAAGGGRWL